MSLSQCSCLVIVALLPLFPYFVEAQEQLCTPDNRRNHISEESTELYLELERALVEDNYALLEKLRVAFLTDVLDEVLFQVEVQVVAGPYDTCGNRNSAFCHVENTINYTSKLCVDQLQFKYFAPSASKRASLQSTNSFVSWSTLVHGNWLSFTIFLTTYDFPLEINEKYVAINLQLHRLNCNPLHSLLLCDIDDLFSWIKLYAENRAVPDTWNREQKGSTSLNSKAYEGLDAEAITSWVSDTYTLFNLCLTEYVFVSLSLALLIAKFFPGIHNQFVTRATSLEYQSLYWGTAAVSNVFVYGFVLVYGRGITLYVVMAYHPPTVYVASILQVIIYSLFLAVSFVTAKNFKTNVSIPKLMAKAMINISFCFTCFCCCVCCSHHSREKLMRVLVIFSLMTSIYHGILEVIAVGFALLVNVSETVTLTALYTLSLLFFVVFSYTIIMTTTKLTHWNNYRQSLKITAVALMLVTIFGAVMFIIIVYMLMIFKLQPGGMAAVVSALVPPVILSVAGWYLKKKLMNMVTTSENEEVYSNETHQKSKIETLV